MTGMVALVFVLGLKHGFDPDHLVAIDGMTRSSKSRWCGLFFSLGHGVVVTLVGIAVALAGSEWQAPDWLEQTGAWISVGVLLFLGVVNLLAVLRTPVGNRAPLIGLRGRWLVDRLAGASHPALIASVGAGFALSFDTMSHALLFSVSGWGFAAALGLTFTLGMVLTDALNSLWVARMMTPANRRWMSLAIAFLCFGIAAGSSLKHALPAPAMSIALLVVILAASVLASRSAYREAGS
jgi:nickel/cobalt transporter (NiCoT) family protein